MSPAAVVASRPTTENPDWHGTGGGGGGGGGGTGRLLVTTYGWKSWNGVGTVVCVRETDGANSDGGTDVRVECDGGCNSRDVDDDDDDVTGSPGYVSRGAAAVTCAHHQPTSSDQDAVKPNYHCCEILQIPCLNQVH